MGFVAGAGNKLGNKHKGEPSARRLKSQAKNARALGCGAPGHDEVTREMITDARRRGARALPDVMDEVILIARNGYSRYECPLTGTVSHVQVEPETRLHAARYLGDRCGLPPRAETEISAAEGMPLTVIVMGTEDAT